MAYQRKTHDEYTVEGNYGCGWEEVTAEDNYHDARQRLREYRLNDPYHCYRLQIKRIKLATNNS
jgi:hypothetical protein